MAKSLDQNYETSITFKAFLPVYEGGLAGTALKLVFLGDLRTVGGWFKLGRVHTSSRSDLNMDALSIKQR